MKKKLVAIVCAAALMLALPTMAFAAPSPTGGSATGDNGVTINVKAGAGSVTSTATTTKQASNVVLTGTEKVLASFEVLGDATDVTLTFNVGTAYAGATVKVFVQHTDGTTEVINGTVAADGSVTITTAKLSVFTVVVDTATAKAAATTTDKSAKSPQTGVDFGTVAGATVVMAIAAGGVAVALRKKITQ